MIDQDLLIIAIIVITFLNWVSSKLKERSARKKGIPQELPQEGLPYQEEVIEEAIEAPEFGGSNQEDLRFKDLIAAITGNDIPQQPAPLLVPDFENDELPKNSTLSKSEDSVNDEKVVATDKSESNFSTINILNRSHSIHPIAQKLRLSGGSKEAIILTEILGKPKALQLEP